jgi:GABA(A) receptor-associated protein
MDDGFVRLGPCTCAGDPCSDFHFQREVSFYDRQQSSASILERYPDRVPILCERNPRAGLPILQKKKFMVPRSLKMGELRQHVMHQLREENASANAGFRTPIYLTVGAKREAPTSIATLGDIYALHKDPDGFLYLRYDEETPFGA